MKIVSIKRLVLSLLFTLGSVMTLPAHAWPDADEMNMCGSAVKQVRAQGANFGGWAAHDIYISQRGLNYYYRANCPESKATKNYKGKNWTPKAKMHVKPAHKSVMKKTHKKQSHKKSHKHSQKHHVKHSRKDHGKHNTHHKNHADCIRTDRLNSTGPIVKKAAVRRAHSVRRAPVANDHFYRQAQAVLNMSKVKRVNTVHNPKHKNHADCVRTAGLNNGGAVVRVVSRKHY